jgi:hypothetical protein
MVEHPALADVVFSGDVHAGLLVQPPVRQSQIVRDSSGLLDHDPVRHEPGIDITGDACGVVSQSHGSTADNEHVRNDAPARQTIAEGGESPFQLGPSQKDVAGLGHAASKSLADK